jgi:hypothetical protein
MRKDQYIIKQAYTRPVIPCRITRGSRFSVPLDDKSYLEKTEEGPKVIIEGVSLMDPRVTQAILCNYSKLKEDSYD